jgi:spore coat polysaccharide biosynthesis protein SpsF
MKFLAAIQARFGSSRLPGKILMDLAGKPVLRRVVERVQKSKYVEEVMVLTSISKKDIPTVNLVSSMDCRVFSGSEDDVLDRYYQASRLIRPEYVIRITADCPVIDPKMLDLAIEQLNAESDYMADLHDTLANGLDLEIVKFSALKNAWENARLASEREHVTMYIKNNRDKFVLQDFPCPIPGIGHHRWTLDEQADYELLLRIYDHFKDGNFYTQDILDFLDENPEINKINAHIIRNEGLARSLKNDRIVNRDE